jgi:hypothetical protein
MTNHEITTRVYATFILRGKELDPQDVTDRLGITPYRSFKRGDRRTEKRKWPHGFWALTTDGHVQSTDLSVHLEWLVQQLEPSIQNIQDIVRSHEIGAEISCLWIFPEEHNGLVLSSQLMRKIADLGVELSFDIYCDR